MKKIAEILKSRRANQRLKFTQSAYKGWINLSKPIAFIKCLKKSFSIIYTASIVIDTKIDQWEIIVRNAQFLEIEEKKLIFLFCQITTNYARNDHFRV